MRDTSDRLAQEHTRVGDQIRERAATLAKDRPGERLGERMQSDRETQRLRRDAETIQKDMNRG